MRKESQAAASTSILRVGTDALTYGLGVVLRRMVSFLMLPVYTRLLTPADYGLLELLDLSLQVVALFVSAGTTMGILRFFYKTRDPEERNRLVGSAFFLLILLNVLGALLLVLLSVPIHRIGLDGQGEIWFLYLLAANFALAPTTEIPSAYMQANREPRKAVTASLSILVMNLGLSIAFVVWLRWGVMGVLLSNLLTTLVGGGVLSGWLVRRIGFSYSYPAMRELRRFAVPYQLSAFGGFILTFGDRFFLQGLQGTDAVGIYSLGYKLGFLASTLGAGPFLSAWTPQRFEISHLPALERDRRYDQGFRVFNALLLPAGVALAVGARPLLRVMSDPAFFPAYTVVPLVALAYVLQGWTAVFRFGIDMSEKTLYQTYSVWASAVVIMVSYATLIPLWGILGAALATLIGFLVRTLLILYFAQRLWPVRFLWRRHLLALAAAVGLTAAFYRLVPPSAGFGPDLVASAIVVITMMAVALMTLIEADERQRTWEGFRQVVGSALARSWRGAR